MILIYIILGFIVFSKVFSVLIRKWRNPFSYTFVFGLKGSSKSTLLCKEAIRHIKKGWTVYTDLPVNIPMVRKIDNADELFKKYTPEPKSLILLDEIGITWHSRDFKSFDKRIREWFKLQRHYYCKVIANSQTWDVDKGLRELTDKLILQTSLFSVIGWSRPIKHKVTLTNAEMTGEGRVVDALVWASPLSWRFLWTPKYSHMFDSFDAPYRPSMPYTTIPCPDSISDIRKLGYSKKVAKAIYQQYAIANGIELPSRHNILHSIANRRRRTAQAVKRSGSGAEQSNQNLPSSANFLDNDSEIV